MKKIFLLPLSMIFLTAGYADELPAAPSVEVAESDSDVAKSHDDQAARPGTKRRNQKGAQQQEGEKQGVPSEKKTGPSTPSKSTKTAPGKAGTNRTPVEG